MFLLLLFWAILYTADCLQSHLSFPDRRLCQAIALNFEAELKTA